MNIPLVAVANRGPIGNPGSLKSCESAGTGRADAVIMGLSPRPQAAACVDV
jgi:hypothetical protein